MFEFITDDDGGQVGAGTLIVFIAMVLVAAIAAGVLIDMAGFQQTNSEETGPSSTNQVTNRVQVVSVVGNVNGSVVDSIALTVTVGSCFSDLNLANATIQYLHPGGETTLVHDSSSDATNSTQFSSTAIEDTDDSEPVLNDDDRVAVSLDLQNVDGGSTLGEGATAQLKITTTSGATRVLELRVPDTLNGKSVVDL